MDKASRFFARIIRNHYWEKCSEVVEQIPFENRILFSKYQRIDAPLTDALINTHRSGTVTLAHALVGDDGNVPHILIDYNGDTPEHFYHHAGKLLAGMHHSDLVTFQSKSHGHLHLYIPIENCPLHSAIEIGTIISKKLEAKLTRQWRVFPSKAVPDAYNIANLPYTIYSLVPQRSRHE